MKTFAEQLAGLKATREAKHTALREVAQKSVDEGRSMNTGEAEQFDTMTDEIKTLDRDIARLSSLVEIDKASATAVAASPAATQTAVGGSGGGGFPVQVKNTQKLEAGVGFARFARIKGLAFTGLVGVRDEMQLAKHIYPGDDALINALTMKAPVNAANTATPTWAGNLINEGGIAFADFVEYLRPLGLLGRIENRLRRLPFDTPVLIQGSGGTAQWVAEGVAKPLTEWTYTRTKLAPLKVAAIAAATKETLMRASASADALIRDELARAVNARLDMTFIDPDAAAVADTSPGSILNGVTPLTGISAGADADDIRCDVALFLNSFVDANLSLQGAFWIFPERIAIALTTLRNPLGQPEFPGMSFDGGTFEGLPVFVTSYANTDSDGSVVALVKGDEIFFGDEGGVQVSMSDQASLAMDSAPSMNSTTPTPATMVSMWQTNSVAFLVERFMNWQRRRTASVAWARVGWTACST